MGNQSEMKTILVTGSNGQLGSELNIISAYESFEFIFTDVEELDITDASAVNSFFNIIVSLFVSYYNSNE